MVQEPLAPQTLLSHLTHRFASHPENIATEALAYILRSYTPARETFLQLLQEFQPGLTAEITFETQDWAAHDRAIPDIVGRDPKGDTPVIIESKFWAGLTDRQPLIYLERLPATSPGLLLFVCPEIRMPFLWDELIRRCRAGAIEFETITTDGRAPRARYGSRLLAVTSWRLLTARMKSALDADRNLAGVSDISQLEGLCNKQDSTAFLPLLSEELTGTNGRRILDFRDLVNEVVQRLVNANLASTAGLSSSASQDFMGRYLHLAQWECLLHINYWRWAFQRATPIWLQLTDRRAMKSSLVQDALLTLKIMEPSRPLDDEGKIQIPIFLPDGVDQEMVIIAMLDQLKEVHRLLSTCPPVEST